MLGGADRDSASLRLVILTPAAPRITTNRRDNACRHRVLVDIPHQRQEIRHIVDGLALETVLENLTRMLVFVVEILRIGNGDTLNRWD